MGENGNGKPGRQITADEARYLDASHAMQSGVAAIIDADRASRGLEPQVTPEISMNCEASPKHLRVGVNSSMVELSVIVKLLVDHGVIEQAEFKRELADAMEAERDRYAARLSQAFGKPVTLA